MRTSYAVVSSDRRCGPALLIVMAVVVVLAMVGLLMMRGDFHRELLHKSTPSKVNELPKS